MKPKSMVLQRLLLSVFLVICAGASHAVTCMNDIPASNQDAVYMDHDDGTVTDTRTGLMWKQCAEGLSGAACSTGTVLDFTWASALNHAESSGFAGYDDWRLPNVKELSSLVERCRALPAINERLFPNTPSSIFWSGSPSVDDSWSAWYVSFFRGASYYVLRSDALLVRLVRDGQSNGETVDATAGFMGPLCLARLQEATAAWRELYPRSFIMFTVSATSTCSTSTCAYATTDQFNSLGIPATVNAGSLADPSLYPNLPGCVQHRSDIFELIGLPDRGVFEAACVAAFLGEPYKVGSYCTGDGFPIPAVLQ